MVTKLDRLARNAPEASALIRSLVDQDISVHILNMGIANNTAMGKLMITILAGFAEFERDMIIERTQAGKKLKLATKKDVHVIRKNRWTMPCHYCKITSIPKLGV